MNSPAELWWVYMLHCRGGRLYTGISNDVVARYLKHCRGKGATFTKLNPPEWLAAAMPVGTRAEALRTEAALKRQPRAEKLSWALRNGWSGPQPTAEATRGSASSAVDR